MLSKFPLSALHLLIGSAAVCSVFLSICGCDQISGSPIVQIIGEVEMDRKPLADTMVAFIPLELRNANGKIIELAFGKTDDAGRFELRTSEARGVSPGEYRILFFRPSLEKDAPSQIDGTNGEDKSGGSTTGVSSDTSLMSAAIDGFNGSAVTTGKQPEGVDVGDVPVAYNIQSELRFTVKPGSGIIYPKFELDAHPKN